MEKTVRAVGTLLLVAVLVLTTLTYAGIFNLSDTLKYVRDGVEKLVTWFIPKTYDVDLIAAHPNATVKGDNVIAIDTALQLNQGVTIGYINVTLEGAPIEVVVEGTAPILVEVYKSGNATALINNGYTVASATIWANGRGYVTLAVKLAQATSSPLEVRVYYRKI